MLEAHYKIFKIFSDTNTPYSIFTIDPITSSILEKKEFSHHRFFEKTHILANVLRKSPAGKNFEEQLKRIAISKNLFLIYNEKINSELIDGMYRVFATLIILEQILKKMKLKNADHY